MEAILWILGSLATVVILILLYFASGIVIKATLLLTPSVMVVGVGALLIYLHPGIFTSIGFMVCLCLSWIVYEKWEDSKMYCDIEKTLNRIFNLS